MNLLNSIGEVIQYIIKWIGMIFKAFPDWFGISGATILVGVIFIIKLFKKK